MDVQQDDLDQEASLSTEISEILFNEARTPKAWLPLEIDSSLLFQLYNLVKMGPTSANCQPARFAFLTQTVSKEKLRSALSEGNIELVMSAPVVVIVAYDPLFYENLSRLYVQAELRSWYAEDVPFAEETALRNSTLQGAYMIMAARALGLDVAPLSGFDNALVDTFFFEEQGWHSNFLLCIGYGDKENLHDRNERLDFDEACLML